MSLSNIAECYLQKMGYEPFLCSSEEEARGRAKELISKKQWPCYFFASDTTGEKDFEEFFTDREDLDMDRFNGVGVIRNKLLFDSTKLNDFQSGIETLKDRGSWDKQSIVNLFFSLLPDFAHKETGKYLDGRM